MDRAMAHHTTSLITPGGGWDDRGVDSGSLLDLRADEFKSHTHLFWRYSSGGAGHLATRRQTLTDNWWDETRPAQHRNAHKKLIQRLFCRCLAMMRTPATS